MTLSHSCPLMHISVDPSDQEARMPNHFFLGSLSRVQLLGKFVYAYICKRKQWRIYQLLVDLISSWWLRDCLSTWTQRTKWSESSAHRCHLKSAMLPWAFRLNPGCLPRQRWYCSGCRVLHQDWSLPPSSVTVMFAGPA